MTLLWMIRTTAAMLFTYSLYHGVHGQFVVTNHDVTLKKDSYGVLPCKTNRTVYGVFWNKGDIFSDSNNIVSLDTFNNVGHRFGPGYDKGLFNITNDFSLVMQNVQVQDEGRYFCAVTDVVLSTTVWNYTFVSVFASPEKLVLLANECNISSSMQREGELCSTSAKVAFNITCIVKGYYPNITLQFHHDSKKIDALSWDEWITTDGTRNKRIVATVVPSEKPYVCEASNIPGSNPHSTISAQISVFKLEDSTAARAVTDPVSSKGIGMPAVTIITIIIGCAGGVACLFAVVMWLKSRTSRHARNTSTEFEMKKSLFAENPSCQCSLHTELHAVIRCIDCNNKPFCGNCYPSHTNHYVLSIAWKKDGEGIELPKSKRREMMCLLHLLDGRIAVGYENGGIDLFCIQTCQRTRILPNTGIEHFAQLPDGNIVICNCTDKKISICRLDGSEVLRIRTVVEKEENLSISVSLDGNILIGDVIEKNVTEFNPSNGTQIGMPKKTSVEPWQMIPLTNGGVGISRCNFGVNDAVRLLDKNGDESSLIEGSPELSFFVTCDRLGHIYVAALDHSERLSISKFSENGDKLEDILYRKKVDARCRIIHWLEMISLSTDQLAIADQTHIYFYGKIDV